MSMRSTYRPGDMPVRSAKTRAKCRSLSPTRLASAGTLSARNVPAIGLLLQAAWVSVLCLTGTYGQLLDYVIFAALIFYVLTMIALFRLRTLRPDLPRPYKAFGYPVVPILYIVAATGVALILLVAKPVYSFSGLFVVLLGIPIYFLWSRGAADRVAGQNRS